VADLSGRDIAWLERRRAELLGLMTQVVTSGAAR
jgi:hypothetical protein